jgi:hypothetical protein
MPFKDAKQRRAYQKRYHLTWEKRNKERRQRLSLERRRGVGAVDYYLRKADEQCDKCAICRQPGVRFGRDLCLDHNHVTGEWRGLLCTPCNVHLAYVENKQWYTNAKKYLAEWTQ